MINTRIVASAFLYHENKVLLLKRGLHKELAPGMWAGIGGHMDMCDIKDPRKLQLMETCYREICEETGINRDNIEDMQLKYTTVRFTGDEIRYLHQFVGRLKSEINPPPCDEGELHWVDKSVALTLPMTPSLKTIYTHWLQNPSGEGIHLVIVSGDGQHTTLVKL